MAPHTLGVAKATILVALIIAVLAVSLVAGLVSYPSRTILSTTTITTEEYATTLTATASATVTQTVAQSTIVGAPSIGAITVGNISIGKSLWGLAVNPSTNEIYATNSDFNVISVITNNVTTVPVQGGSLYVAVNPKTNLVYVNNDSCGPCTQSISVISGSTDKVVGGINLGTYVDGIAVDPATDMIYASSADSDSLFIINGVTDALVANVALPGSAMMVAVNPSTNTVYVPICTTTFVCAPAFVLAISGSSHAILSKVPIDLPFAISVDSQSNMIYVTTAQNLLVGINGNTNKVTDTKLSAFSLQCRGVDVNSASDEIYVSCSAQQGLPSFFIVDGSNSNILNSFVDNGSPMGVAFDSGNGMIYLAHSNGYVLVLKSTQILLP